MFKTIRLFVLVVSCVFWISGCAQHSKKLGNDESVSELLELDTPTLLNLAREAEAEHRLHKAISHYKSLLKKEDSPDFVRKKLSELYCQSGQFIQCRDMYKEILEIYPDNMAAAEGLAYASLKLGELDSAKEQYLAILEVNPDSYKSLNYLGVISDLAGDYRQSAKYYDLALLRKPEDPTVLNNLGYSLLMSKQYDEAQRVFERALSVSGNEALRIKNNLSIVYARQKKYSEAIELVSPTMDNPVVYNNVGYIALLNGDYQKAMQYFEKAITLSPKYYERADFNLKRTKKLIEKNRPHIQS